MSAGNILGAVIGVGLSFIIPGLGWQVGLMMGSAIGGALFPPPGPDGPRLKDLTPQSSEYGRPIPITYGTIAISGNVIWAMDLIEIQEDSGGGKGGTEQTTYRYLANFAVAICEGEVSLGRIWAGPEKRLIWDGTTLEGGGEMRFYPGSETQLPDPLIESDRGVGLAPAYRGTAYVVFENFPVEKDGNRIPFLTVEVGRTTNTAVPDNLGIAWFSQVLLTNDYYIVFYWGTYYGIIVRRRSDNSLYKHYHIDGYTIGAGWAWDEDRKVLIKATGAANFVTVPIATGVLTLHNLSAHPTETDTNLGYFSKGVVYHNGKYIVACSGSAGQVDRVTLFGVDPDTFETAWSYASNTGAAGEIVSNGLMKPNDETGTSNWVYVYSDPGKLTMHYTLLEGVEAVLDLGTPAPYLYKTVFGVDPVTNYIWTASQANGSATANYTYHDPVFPNSGYPPTPPGLLGGSTMDFTSAGLGNIAFGPNQVLFWGDKWLAQDYYVLFTASGTGPTYPTTTKATYHGSAEINVMFYNSGWYIVRTNGIVTFSSAAEGPTDPYNAGVMGATFDEVTDNWYIGQGDTSFAIQGQSLASIVSDLSVRAGLTTDQIDVTALTDTVDGYAIARQTSVREAISALAPAFFFDAVESGTKIKYVKRGGPIVVSVPDKDVGAYPSNSEGVDPLNTVRRMDNELPRILTVNYILEATGYSPAVRLAKRLIGSSGEESTLELPIVCTDTKAQEVAEVNLHGAWIGRLSYSFPLPRKYSYLEPTDVIAVHGYVMRLTKVTAGIDGVLKCESAFDDTNVYEPETTVTETVATPKTVAVSSATTLELL